MALYCNGDLIQIKSSKKLGVIGDSISSDQFENKNQAWVRPLVEMMGNPTLYRHTLGGTRILNGADSWIKKGFSKIGNDCDMVICLMGRNDSFQNHGNIGDINTIMDMSLDDLENDYSTIMGQYRYGLETIKNRLHSNAIIVCVAPITETLIDGDWSTTNNVDWKAAYEGLQKLRKAIRDFVKAEGGANNGWVFLDGRQILQPEDVDVYYYKKDNGSADTTHPNKAGQAIMAGWIYTHVPNINLIERP